MSAQIISLAERRELAKVRQDGALTGIPRAATFAVLAQVQRNSAVPHSRGGRTEEEDICRRIQQIADNLGIDVEAPFRRKPDPKGGGQ